MEVLVEYDYVSQNPDELTIKKGDRIRNVMRKEEGWYEGELANTGRRGVFPDNFVKQIKPQIVMNPQNGMNNPLKTIAFSAADRQNHSVKSPDDKKKNFLSNTVIGFNGSANNNNNNMNNPVSKFQQQQQPLPASSPPPPVSLTSNNKVDRSQPPPPPNPKPSLPQSLPSSDSIFSARVLYSYVPVNEDELAIQENEIVKVIRLVEDGWYEGIYNGMQGVFPSNYVEKVTETSSNDSYENNDIEQTDDKRNPKNKKVLGIGFGNIFSGKTIQLQTKENFSNVNNKINNNNNTNVSLNRVSDQQHQPQESLRKRVKAKVLFDYLPTQPDELKLTVGEVIYILDRNLEDEGWWKGESISSGKVGVFPDNFVEEIIDSTAVPNGVSIAKRNSNGLKSSNKITINNVNNNTNGNHAKTAVVNGNDQIAISSSSASSTSTSSTTSSSSTINSLSRQPGVVMRNQQQPQLADANISKSQSDISEDLDDIQPSDKNKLIHIKKTRQFNKRPPSFRTKHKDTENETSIDKSTTINGQQYHNNNVASSPINQNGKKSAAENVNNSRQTTPISPKLSPSSTHDLISTSVVSNITNASTNSLLEEITILKQELDTVRKDSSQIHLDYKSVSGELSDLRNKHEDQMKKMQKKLENLVIEIDEEKKTRLALQVELERLKKTIMNQ